MKKMLPFLVLLLASILLLASCDTDAIKTDESDTTTNLNEITDSDTTTESDTPTDSDTTTEDVLPHPYNGTVYGYWFSDADNSALEITKDSNAAKYYSCQPGYYAYYAYSETTYTYDEETSELTLPLEGTDYIFIYDESADEITLSWNNKTLTYVRYAEAPAEHPTYSFPNYGEMELSSILTLPDYHGYTNAWELAEADAKLEIFKEYFDTGLEAPGSVTDRAAAYGDIVIIDYVGKHDGVAFSGGTASNQEITIITNSGYIPGFVEGIIGHRAGETFDVNVTFPEVYPNSPELAGQPVVFEMTLRQIYQVELTDAQFATFTDLPYPTYDAWVAALSSDLLLSHLFPLIQEDTVIAEELPQETYLYFYQYYLDYAHYMADAYGISYEQYCSYMRADDAQFLELAKQNALEYLICYQIASENSLTWSDEQYNTIFASYVKNLTDNGYSEADAALYVQNNQINDLRAELTKVVVEEYLKDCYAVDVQ